MGIGKFNAGGKPAMDWHPIQYSYGNWDKLRPDGHLGSYADFTLPYLKLGHYKLNSFGDCCLKYFLILSCSFLTVGIWKIWNKVCMESFVNVTIIFSIMQGFSLKVQLLKEWIILSSGEVFRKPTTVCYPLDSDKTSGSDTCIPFKQPLVNCPHDIQCDVMRFMVLHGFCF